MLVADQVLDCVDLRDEVVGTVALSALRDIGANIRVAHVLVTDGSGRVLLQKRGPTRSLADLWGSSASGHVHAGESYAVAGAREARRILGVHGLDLYELGKTWIDEPYGRKFVTAFTCEHRGPFDLEPAEASRVEFVPIDEVARMLRTRERSFTPTFRRVFGLLG